MVKVTINTEYITLGQFLKFTKIIGNGGDAKIYLMTNSVFVNDELELRRGRKLRANDCVKVDGKEYIIECESTN